MKRLLFVLAACGNSGGGTPDAAPMQPVANPDREIVDTGLVVDYAGKTTVAQITFGPGADGASVETGTLTIDSVTVNGAPITFTTADKQTDLGLPASTDPVVVTFSYSWTTHENFEGISAKGWTLDWPYYCGNVFPCHSHPVDGTTFSLQLNNTPDGKTAVYPQTIPNQAPAYQLAWSIDAYTQLDLGTTAAGTLVSTWYRAGEETKAMTGTQHLLAAFDWLETHLGPYTFGNHYGSVAVTWPIGAIGGMEHHPFIHIGGGIDDENTQVHEASHGWFGDGIRLACWEDFVLSEGTVSYLANHALEAVGGTPTWTADATELASQSGSDAVWIPSTCNVIDVNKIFTRALYDRGEFFYKGIADKIGADKLDQALTTFYMAHKSQPARMQDMLDTIQQVTGYDPSACAQTWLLDTSSATPPTPGPCP
ncbi:MAG: M1 family aminopeptidase [Kofleriaceae bacterium]